jgi:hypothetical protein
LDELDSEYLSIGIHGIENGRTRIIVTGLIAFFMGVCGVAVLFMLTFLCALHREVKRPRIRFSSRRENPSRVCFDGAQFAGLGPCRVIFQFANSSAVLGA